MTVAEFRGSNLIKVYHCGHDQALKLMTGVRLAECKNVVLRGMKLDDFLSLGYSIARRGNRLDFDFPVEGSTPKAGLPSKETSLEGSLLSSNGGGAEPPPTW